MKPRKARAVWTRPNAAKAERPTPIPESPRVDPQAICEGVLPDGAVRLEHRLDATIASGASQLVHQILTGFAHWDRSRRNSLQSGVQFAWS
jgi:hypothetical protein